MLWQPSLDPAYRKLSTEQLDAQIVQRKAELGDSLVILGHHYQQDDVVKHADFLGDSFKLSQLAAQKVQEVGAKYVIFCGVHFMAESADILTPDTVSVILPDLSAGCSMADMAAHDDVTDAWDQLTALHAEHQPDTRIIPITYMNSTAAIKSFVGKNGGAVCTSSNADKILRWAFAGGTQTKSPTERIKIIFLPDQHLGRNTCADLGYDPATDMALYDPQANAPLGGATPHHILNADAILWKGHCSVHKLFRPEHVDEIRAASPETTVIVHPECMYEVVRKADIAASTEGIIAQINAAPPGSSWAVGTEVHMVNRLANQHTDKRVRMLSDCQCLCTTMYRINPQHLLWTLDNLVAGTVVNQIKVDADTTENSLIALQRMLDITAAPAAPTPPTSVTT